MLLSKFINPILFLFRKIKKSKVLLDIELDLTNKDI